MTSLRVYMQRGEFNGHDVARAREVLTAACYDWTGEVERAAREFCATAGMSTIMRSVLAKIAAGQSYYMMPVTRSALIRIGYITISTTSPDLRQRQKGQPATDPTLIRRGRYMITPAGIAALDATNRTRKAATP